MDPGVDPVGARINPQVDGSRRFRGYGSPRMRRPPLPSPRIARTLADAGVFAAVAGTAVLERVWELPDHAGWRWVLAAGLSAALLATLRRQQPFVAVAGVLALWAVVHTDRAATDPAFQFISLLVAAYALGAHGRGWQGPAGLVVAAACFSGLNLARGEGADAALAGSVQFLVLYVFGVVIGRALARERALERERDERAATAVADERARIARDLHDSLGHSISVMVLQAGAVRRRLGEHRTEEAQALEQIEGSGRQAVAELRRMLGLLREGSELAPVPSVDRVDEVAQACREAGVEVEVRTDGERRPLPTGVDMAAFRIVQESLTNVLKHARARKASVHIAYRPDAVEVSVRDDGAGANGDLRSGHGLIGMRERAALYGGELEAGPAPEGGFAVRARLPTEGESS